MADTLHITLLGRFGLVCGEAPVTALDSERLQSLLAYVVLHRGAPVPRRHAAFSFWPDSREKQAMSNLRNLLYVLRRTWPEADRFLAVDAKTLRWKPDAPFTLDVAAFEQALTEAEEATQRADEAAARSAFEKAVGLYRGELLPGCYDEWVLPERERLHQACVRATERLVTLLEARRDYRAAIHQARRLLQLDALREATHRVLMRLHALNRDRAAVQQAYAACEDLLRRELDLAPEPATRALYERLMNAAMEGAREPAAPEAPAGSLPLVGRHEAWRHVRAAWEAAARGSTRLLVITGEAGIGKTRLAEELLDWACRQGVATAQARAYAAEGRLAYAPVTQWLRTPALRAVLDTLDPVWLVEVARLVPELRAARPDLPAPAPLAARWQHQHLLEALARAVLAGGRPLLLLFDDLQWCDAETLAWLRFLLQFAPEARLLVAGTVRVEEVGPSHPLRALLLDLGRLARVTEVALGPLDADETVRLAASAMGRALDAAAAERLYRDTEGNPLFIVETVRAGLHADEDPAGDVPEAGAAPGLLPEVPALPPTVQAVIARRLAQLSPEARALAGLGAVLGRAFSFEVLARASTLDEAVRLQALDELLQRRILREQEGDVYDFSHDKLREGALAGISAARKRLLHRHAAEALEAAYADDLDAVSAQVAAQYEQAGLAEPGVAWYQRAARVAGDVYANAEAAGFLARALRLLHALPAGRAREVRELALLQAQGPALIATSGWAAEAVGQTFARARVLCEELGKTDALFAVLWGRWTFHLVRAELPAATELAAALLHLAEGQSAPPLLRAAHLARCFTAFHRGALAEARDHLARADVVEGKGHPAHDPFPGATLGVFGPAYAAHLLWHLGYPDQARERMEQALARADASPHPFDAVVAGCHAATLHQLLGEPQAVRDHAAAAAGRAREHGFPYYEAWAAILEGWVLAERGGLEAGVARMRQSLADLRATGAVLRVPYYLALLAAACGRDGQATRALALLEEARAAVDRTDERWMEAELYRLCGVLLATQGNDAAADATFAQAVDVARRQQARTLELRAVVSRGRLWHRQGRAGDARTMLAAVVASHSEGDDTRELHEARRLLEAWA